MKRKYEYTEGEKARENFERLTKAVFAAKPKHKEKGRKPKKATARKTHGKDEG